MEKLVVLQSRLEPVKWLLKWILCFPKEAWKKQQTVNTLGSQAALSW